MSCSRAHAAAHAATHPDHSLAVVIDFDAVFCFACARFVYDNAIDAALAAGTLAARARIRSWAVPAAHLRVHSAEWLVSAEDMAAASQRVGVKRALGEPSSAEASEVDDVGMRIKKRRRGLRGLNNFGNSCFMSCVLQTLLHNPLLRAYFLSHLHDPTKCTVAKKRCLGCNMVSLFTQTLSGSSLPMNPSEFLHSIWVHSKYLAGYEQQDAHEFLISVLDGIHTHSRNQVPLPVASVPLPARPAPRCSCVVHSVFSGILSSKLVCLSCGASSPSYDPFVDVSLQISSEVKALEQCLLNFTSSERLSVELPCRACAPEGKRPFTKRLQFQELPLTLAIHLKRFESHGGTATGSSVKLSDFVSFPLVLDMAPYVARESQSAFAVVVHIGSIDAGHYIAYVRVPAPTVGAAAVPASQLWFRCDDAVVTLATVKEVLASEAYLLFYVKREIDYHDLGKTEIISASSSTPRAARSSVLSPTASSPRTFPPQA
ncbi:ubiquitin carboxyl-terminal hydrolase [Thecamonas trahens ATCC 50062]|uniref:Ubiquitin carboxyl-terminal hydrolase n=1 Tax=Thecamonas trahens ATCC 50062 TaxID=461836 RepID=A0A0L0DBR3_THETB|nr:ubiquitin carboxyl-terminal hydrolase [Thecamonas trahens ATCC 50062]KNC48743.1 ubiquitin carboxyl-terminal hydrolase [Thecamonas trahens ATCC 50062]|eukprot:XP_013762794.1 ubiquitin carboxyl-terminal hydrolase [Thecamonas trahens ATCC 50062]